MKKLYIFITISIVVHIVGYYLPEYALYLFDIQPQNFAINQPPPPPLEVTLEENPHDKFQILVPPQELEPEQLDLKPESLKEKSDFMSDHTQRVKDEVQAKVQGKTQNASKQTSNKKINPMLNPNKLKWNNETHKKSINDETNSDEGNAPSRPPIIKPYSPNITTIPSQSNVNSDRVKFGDFTALNTDRNLYFSFFSRIEDAVRPQWEMEVQNTLENLQKLNLHIAPQKFKTRIDILLDSEGHFFKAVLLKSSGVSGLDNAVINSFKSAKFFPHPPKGMINPTDGLIRLEYMFHVEYNP